MSDLNDVLVPGVTPGTAFLSAALAGDKAKIDTIFSDIVWRSYQTHPMRQKTGDEDVRRGRILIKWFRILRGDMKWPLDRVLHEIGRALRAELEGRDYTPSESVLYRVDDGVEDIAADLRASPLFRKVGGAIRC